MLNMSAGCSDRAENIDITSGAVREHGTAPLIGVLQAGHLSVLPGVGLSLRLREGLLVVLAGPAGQRGSLPRDR
jgi:hypothetical protein